MVSLKCFIISILAAYIFQMILILYLFSDNKMENEKNYRKRKDWKEFDEIFEKTCRVNNSDALSAIRRAKTRYCKYEIARTACRILEGNFYPESLPHSCPNNGMTYGKYLGCYKDEFKPRILPNFNDASDSNTRKRCLDLCVLGGFPYAGVQYAKECFCGNERPSSTKLKESSCNMTCSGASNETCGGPLAINVFETGVAKFTYVTPATPSNSAGQVRIVFLLTLSGRTLRQVHRLINALYRSHHYYYIHVDLRSDYLHRNLLLLEERFPNIMLVKKRFVTIWAGVTFWRMILSSFKDLIDLGWQWDFVTNLSESDFPIQSIENLEKFISANKNRNFLSSSGTVFKQYIYKQGLDKTFIECEERMWLIGERNLPKGIIVDGASDWMTLSREFVSYLVGEKDELLSGFDKIFNYTIFGPESYFHMVIRNSRFCNKYVNNDLHYTNWKGDQGCQCHKKIIDWCGCSPVIFKTEMIGTLQNAKDRYFARKFEAVINQDIINKVEDHIGINDHHSIDTLHSYWQNIFNYKDIKYLKEHDLLMTHAKSLTRINAKNFNEDGCDIKPGSIYDIHLYNYADIYWGNLILHKANFEGKEIVLETWYKPIPIAMERNRGTETAKRLKIFQVGSNYDKKEMIFRNYANILGPYSELNLLYEFTPSEENVTETFSVKWIEPSGNISYTHKIHVSKGKLREFVTPALKLPIQPGVWTVKLYENEMFLASRQFLISPLEPNAQVQAAAEIYNQIPKPPIQKELDKISQDSSLDGAKINSEITTSALDLIDELNTQFYSVVDTCVSKTSQIKEPIKCGSRVINICESTQWSTLYPDPKGFLGILNKKTGKLERTDY